MNILKKNKIEIAILLFVPMLFLYKMIFIGQVVTTNDELERHPINEWRDNYLLNNDNTPQWFPNLFSGMPSYGGYIYTDGDPTKILRNKILFNPGLKVWFYLSLCGIGMYIFLKLSGITNRSALFGSLISSLTPYSFGLINAGHLNKIFAMAYIPWVIVAALYLINKFSLKAILFLALMTALQLWANHPQIAYYTWMLIGFYFFWHVGSTILAKKFNLKAHIKTILGIAISLFLALFMVADPYGQIYEFQKESDRGLQTVLDEAKTNKANKTWEYSTRWSFHPAETVSFILPYYFGLQNTQSLSKGAYWGYMPFTQSTHYLGFVIIIFSILGALIKKPDKMGKVFWVISLITLVTGFGSFFPLFYKPFFDFFPFFSKFRVPSMIYVLLAVTVPYLGAKGLDIFVENLENKNTLKILIKFFAVILSFLVLLLIFEQSFLSYSTASDARYNINTINKLKEARSALFQKGLFLSIGLSLSMFFLSLGLLKGQINKNKFLIAVISVALLDLWIINYEFLNLKSPQNFDLTFKTNERIEYLKKDKDHFRILPADKMGSNWYSYWNLESVSGYRPIKLRNYQDLMDAGGLNNPSILDMLNVKYVLTRKKINNINFQKVQNINGLYQNKNVLPKSWIVKKITSAKSQKESLLKTLSVDFKPESEAIVVDYSGKYLNSKSSGIVSIIKRVENRLELSSKSETGGLLVLSEIFYRPGWRAYVNGQLVPIYQANHILRSIEVPAGDSNILFEYDVSNWSLARLISRSFFILIMIILGFVLYKKR